MKKRNWQGILLALPIALTAGVVTAQEMEDTEPPEVTCTVDKEMLWAPNHKMTDVGLQITATDNEDEDLEITVEVYSNQDDYYEDGANNGNGNGNGKVKGSGNFSPDARWEEDNEKLYLRSERSGKDKSIGGRVYLIIVTATDDAGNEGHDCCTVVIPHDRSPASVEQVKTEAEAAEAQCDTTGMPPMTYFRVGEEGEPVVGKKQ